MTQRLAIDPREVADALWIDLDQLASGGADTRYEHRVTTPSARAAGPATTTTYDLPAYQASGKLVWGMTYGMLRSLMIRLAGPQSSGTTSEKSA